MQNWCHLQSCECILWSFLNILLILNYFAAWVFALATVAHRYVNTNYRFVGGAMHVFVGFPSLLEFNCFVDVAVRIFFH